MKLRLFYTIIFLSVFLFINCTQGYQNVTNDQFSTVQSNSDETVSRTVKDSSLELSVTAGDFINKIVVFAFYNRQPSGVNGITIRYSTSNAVTENCPELTADGYQMEKTGIFLVAAFDNHGSKIAADIGGKYTRKDCSRTTFDPGSGVMLQGFFWDSVRDNSKRWYIKMKDNIEDIQKNFALVWFPPPSKSSDFAHEGYGPSELNNLTSCYGTVEELSEIISLLHPLPAIADIVINHRSGTTSWADFSNPQWTKDYVSVCANDSFFMPGNPGCTWTGEKGAEKSSPMMYESFRNLDHSSTLVQQGITSWMNSTLFRVGFSGWRYDYVRGYNAAYTRSYSDSSSAVFSVGEYWPISPFGNSMCSWSEEICNWQNAANEMFVFDFVLKGIITTISESNELDYSLLKSSDCIFRKSSGRAVTFIDNHDTLPCSDCKRSTWMVQDRFLGQAYAFMLMSPGFPCVIWSDYFSESGVGSRAERIISGTGDTCRQHIQRLIALRKDANIRFNSSEKIIYSGKDGYVSCISTNGTPVAILKIGTVPFIPTAEQCGIDIDSSCFPEYVGSGFSIWLSKKTDTEKTKDIGYANPNSWKTVYVHCWDSIHGKDYTSWPGIAMTESENRIFTTSIPVSCDCVVFNDGGNSKTTDIRVTDFSY